ncbi:MULTISPECIES: hypothetical protein [Bacillus cereus group]|uniref:hypothetical protein n=1 Tax=Bacillus cereus group TaxID=86661 RepID=UPI000C2012D5|nr:MULTISPECIES: hypothetical protein [Bacillus cereus group]MCM3202699.1 hypothetical protein [Bacillus cereus]MEB9694864.1 hypothetical protein [Bacillus cereus]
MGMYTAFRGKVTIKAEYKELVELINDGDWEEAVDKHPFLKEYYDIERSTLIPFNKEVIQNRCNEVGSWTKAGELYLETGPFDWKTDSSYFTNLKGLEWTFIACLKNYADKKHSNKTPIGVFIEQVLSEIVSEITKIQVYYEEWDKPVEYEFQKVKILNKFFKKKVVNKIVVKR